MSFRTANLFLDSAVFHQFREYLKERESNIDHNVQKRETTDDIQKQMEEFLRDVYPGLKTMPNELIDLMTSPDPQKAMSIKANLNTEEDKCNAKSDSPSQSQRKKRSSAIEKSMSPGRSQRKKRSSLSEFNDFGCPDVDFNEGACKNLGKCPNGGWIPFTGTNRRKCIGYHVSTIYKSYMLNQRLTEMYLLNFAEVRTNYLHKSI